MIFAANGCIVIYTALLQASKLVNISWFFWSHRVQMLLVLYAALGFSCSTRCPLPRKHQLQLSPPPRLGGGSLGTPSMVQSDKKKSRLIVHCLKQHTQIGIQSTRTQSQLVPSQLVPKSTRTQGQLVPKCKRNAK